ncbi:MAG TPA: glycosyltransferase family 4 protein [Oscillospiraceae bacterium]|nr:glycosyltransferase family 4 protein [Oscillospiraceae bacterium]HPF55334.1 glycosyltransferase family 4 protein [Clostridiales bacterium]HPK36082.1 glycosyltransferase family 4 protein [Oscillospiraceae bacterium]HPR76492.1 glycosyltransferase family 4 protein [Oscillospiraceae bacterium]
MRVLLYINSLSNGGAERVMSVLANGLNAHGHDIVLITDYYRGNEYQIPDSVERIVLVGKFEERPPGMSRSRSIFNIRNLRLLFEIIHRNNSSIKKLRTLCIERKFDVLISFLPKNNFRALLAVRRLKIKNLISVRNDPGKIFKSLWLRRLVKLLYRFTDGCVFQTEEQKNRFPVQKLKNFRIIPNPVSDVFYQTERAESGHKDIVAVGRLEPQKNFPMLIRAFARIADDFPNENLVIYGKGKLKEELAELAKKIGLSDRIRFPGNVPDIAEKIKNARLFVLSSDWEGLPNALMESMAIGLPVIATDCAGGGARALIHDGVNGLLIPKGDEQALANAMRKLLESQALSDDLGEAAKQSAQAYRTDEIVARWEEYLLEIGGENDGRIDQTIF